MCVKIGEIRHSAAEAQNVRYIGVLNGCADIRPGVPKTDNTT